MRFRIVLFALFVSILIIGCTPKPSVVRPERVIEDLPVAQPSVSNPVAESTTGTEVATVDVTSAEKDLNLGELNNLESDLDLINW